MDAVAESRTDEGDSYASAFEIECHVELSDGLIKRINLKVEFKFNLLILIKKRLSLLPSLRKANAS